MFKKTIASIILFSTFINSYCIELIGEKSIIKFLKADLNGDGIKEEIKLIPKRKNFQELNYPFDLEIKSKEKTFLIENVIVSNHSSCGLEIVEVSSNYKPFIGISQKTGRHSGILTLYTFGGEGIKEFQTFFSNLPSILLEDVDNDGENEIVVINKDLESNNPMDKMLDTYNFDGEIWRLVSIYSTRLKKYIPEDEWRYLRPKRANKIETESLKIKVYR